MKRTGQTARTAAARTYVALLRGINVGGKNKLPMGELASMFVEAGGTQVTTYIQSGNVVFRAAASVAEQIVRAVSRKIADRFNFEPPIILRSAVELQNMVTSNPFLSASRAGKGAAARAIVNGTGAKARGRSQTAGGSKLDLERTLHVAFLADRPDKGRIAAMDPNRSPGDSFEVRGQEVFLHLPNGVAKTKLTNEYLDRTLGTTSTLRNWRTVLKLIEMSTEAG
jgi:uncharacterized protein (DUF1697 family)